ncbi:MAG: EFR1 family ferrodoxin [Prevotella sp.]|nr:EFR1 family ferrodoxin [Prevotella sp.]
MIFYFSGTGNTRWAATILAERLGERLVDIAETMYSTDTTSKEWAFHLTPGERVGFCFPVHGWQPPRVVRTFISGLTLHGAGSHYYYALCTCGDNIGETMAILSSDLRKRSLSLDACFSLIMPESYVALPFMYTDTIEREREKLTKAAEDIDRYAAMISERRKGESWLVKGRMPWLLSYIVGGYFNKRMISDKKFTVDADKCIGCGRCAKACPVGDMSMEKGKPRWLHDNRCTSCLACYHHCPCHAINYGSVTRNRDQYYFGRNNEKEI